MSAACGDAVGVVTDSGTGLPPGTSSTGAAAPTSSPTSDLDVTVTAPDASSSSGAVSDGGEGSGGGGTSTGVAEPTCGDGVVQDGEECEPAAGDVDEVGPCTHHCKAAFCGDGEVWSVDCDGDQCEECDPGVDADDVPLCDDACCACRIPPSLCGDGHLDEGEECDFGESKPDYTPPPDKAPCNHCEFGDVLRVFVTSAAISGKIGVKNGDDVLAAADKFCQEAAKNATHKGEPLPLPRAEHYRAWLSRKRVDGEWNCPDNRFKYAKEYRQYILVDGTKVAASWSELVKPGPLFGINRDEHGHTVADGEPVWTATDNQGLELAKNCADWTDELSTGNFGLVGKTAANWTNVPQKTRFCGGKQRLYCFEDEVDP